MGSIGSGSAVRGSLPPRSPSFNRSGQHSNQSRTPSRSNIPSRCSSTNRYVRGSSTSTDSSSSSDLKEHGSERATNGQESSFISKINQSFGWLRRQPSDLIPWWLPSTESVPGVLASAPEEIEKADEVVDCIQVEAKEHSDSLESSTDEDDDEDDNDGEDDNDDDDEDDDDDDEGEDDCTENKKDDTDEEVEDLPADFGVQAAVEATPETLMDSLDEVKEPVELGDRSSPDGFEWPENNSPPLRTRNYYRPYSPYDNVRPIEDPISDGTSRPAVEELVNEADTFNVWGVGYDKSLDKQSRSQRSTKSPSSESSNSSSTSSSTSSTSSTSNSSSGGSSSSGASKKSKSRRSSNRASRSSALEVAESGNDNLSDKEAAVEKTPWNASETVVSQELNGGNEEEAGTESEDSEEEEIFEELGGKTEATEVRVNPGIKTEEMDESEGSEEEESDEDDGKNHLLMNFNYIRMNTLSSLHNEKNNMIIVFRGRSEGRTGRGSCGYHNAVLDSEQVPPNRSK